MAWFFLIYGFGQLVENSDILAGRTDKEDETVQDVQYDQEQEEMSNEDKIDELNTLLDKGLISYPKYLQLLNELEEDGK